MYWHTFKHTTPFFLLWGFYEVGVCSYTLPSSAACLPELGQTAKDRVTLCRSFFADVPDHSRPPRSFMIVTKPSDRGLNSRSLSAQDCQYDLSTTVERRWYDGSVWSALSTFSTTISTTTNTVDTTALTMLTTTPTLLPICYRDINDLTDWRTIPSRVWRPSEDRCTLHTTTSTLPVPGDRPWPRTCTRSGWSLQSASIDSGKVIVWYH